MELQTKEALSKVSVVLPSLDPDDKLTAVINGMLDAGFTDIILVNDGSRKENLHYFEDAARLHPEVTVLHHDHNLGKGAALKTAFRYFLDSRPGYAGVVTVDGDNQHHPEDTRACTLKMLEDRRVVLGARDFNLPGVPARSKKGNHITSAVFKIFCGMTLSDTQTGLRAIPAIYLADFLEVSGERFEYETNMLLKMKQESIPYEELKIRTVYIEENKSSHFRVVRDSVRIYSLILAHFLKYSASAVLCFGVETGLYALFNHLWANSLHDSFLVLKTAVPARALSSILNFLLNKKIVFEQKGSTGKVLGKYYLLVAAQLSLQILLTDGVYRLFDISSDATFLRTVLYVVVMGVLFFLSYTFQRNWVFKSKRRFPPKKDGKS